MSTVVEVMTAHTSSSFNGCAFFDAMFFLVVTKVAVGIFNNKIISKFTKTNFTSFGFFIHVAISATEWNLSIDWLVVFIVANDALVGAKSAEIFPGQSTNSSINLILTEFNAGLVFMPSCA